MSDLVLQLKQINKYFGRSHVIKDVNIDFEKGHFVTFLGPSGCGKTTLLRMVAGFYEPDDGEILLNGKRIERIPPYSRNTAMVFQEYALFPHMNVFDNVSYGLRVKNRPKEEIERRVKEALDLMQLKGMEDRFPNQMSGGQQQRVAVARALVMNPEVLLLDEPLSNLNAKLRESVRVSLMELTNWHRDMQKKGTEHSVSRLCELLGPLPLEGALYLMARAPHEEISSSVSQYIYKWKQIKVDISGDDLHNLGLEPGPRFGKIMRRLLAAKLDDEAPTRESQLELARTLIEKGYDGPDDAATPRTRGGTNAGQN